MYSAILESLKHRNIVALEQKIRDKQNERIYIVMEVSECFLLCLALELALMTLSANRRLKFSCWMYCLADLCEGEAVLRREY
jgi:hypothetical protein